MAIGAGSIVALKVASAGLTIGFQTAQPPVFGVAQGAMPGAIDWYSGTQTTTVTAAVVDEILNPDPSTQALIGLVVTITGYSSSYNAIVVSAYNRNGTQECVLVKTLENGAFLELDATTVTVVASL
jgi:hypothetical protein